MILAKHRQGHFPVVLEKVERGEETTYLKVVEDLFGVGAVQRLGLIRSLNMRNCTQRRVSTSFFSDYYHRKPPNVVEKQDGPGMQYLLDPLSDNAIVAGRHAETAVVYGVFSVSSNSFWTGMLSACRSRNDKAQMPMSRSMSIT